MQITEIWYGHKRFILILGAGLALFLVLKAAIGRIEAMTERARVENDSVANEVEEDLSRLEGKDGVAKGLARLLTERLEPEVQKELAFEVREPFLLPKNEPNPYFYYANRLKAALSEIQDLARRRNLSYPANLGLPEKVEEKRTEEGLARVYVTREVCRDMISRGVEVIASVKQLGTEYIPLVGREECLRRIPLRLEIACPTEGLIRFLLGFQKAGRFLEVEDIRLGGDGSESLKVHLTLAALNIVVPPADVAAKERGGRRTPGDRRRPTRLPYRRRTGRRR